MSDFADEQLLDLAVTDFIGESMQYITPAGPDAVRARLRRHRRNRAMAVSTLALAVLAVPTAAFAILRGPAPPDPAATTPSPAPTVSASPGPTGTPTETPTETPTGAPASSGPASSPVTTYHTDLAVSASDASLNRDADGRIHGTITVVVHNNGTHAALRQRVEVVVDVYDRAPSWRVTKVTGRAGCAPSGGQALRCTTTLAPGRSYTLHVSVAGRGGLDSYQSKVSVGYPSATNGNVMISDVNSDNDSYVFGTTIHG